MQDAAKDFPRIRAVDRLEPISERTRTELTAATKEHEAAKAKYTREIEKARKAELAPGDLFGRAEDVIPIQVWRNRFFPLEDAKALREGLDTFLGGSDVSPWIRGIEQAANHIRFLSAIGDMAAPFTHGPLLAANSPSAWAKATLASYKAWLDPTVQARFIVDHRDTILEMAQHNVPIGDVEMFRVLQEGGGLSPGQMLEVLPRGGEIRGLFQGAGKQTFGRFQSAYDVFLLESRTLVWEGMKPNWQGTTAEMAEHVRNISGGLDSRALGVPPSQRGLESFLLAFSPRLFRSTVALVANLRLGLKNPRGFAAYKTLGNLLAGITGLYIASGFILGKSEEELLTGLNPLEGKKFLSHQINGDWVGVGGLVRAGFQMGARAVADPKSLLSPDRFDNPAIRAFYERGAVGVSLISATVELVTGADTEPYADIDTPADLFKHVGTSAFPFTIQGQLEGEEASTGGFSFTGLRTSPETPFDRLAAAFKEEFKFDYDSGEGHRKLAESKPHLATLLEELVRVGVSTGRQFAGEREEREQAKATLAEDVAPFAEGVRVGNSDAGEQFRRELTSVKTAQSGVSARDFFDKDFPEPDTELGQALARLGELNPKAAPYLDDDPETGNFTVDWDRWEADRGVQFDIIEKSAPGFTEWYLSRTFLPEEFADVEVPAIAASKLRNELGELSPVIGLEPKQYQEVRSFLGDVADARNNWRVEFGANIDLEDAIFAVANEQGRSPVFTSWALELRGGIKDELRNREYDQFIIDNAGDVTLTGGGMRLFYPSLYTRKAIALGLSVGQPVYEQPAAPSAAPRRLPRGRPTRPTRPARGGR